MRAPADAVLHRREEPLDLFRKREIQPFLLLRCFHPYEEVKGWGDFSEDRYISETTDRGRVAGFTYEDGKSWNKGHTKKRHSYHAPALTVENYSYKDRIFCKYCGGRLRRILGHQRYVFWICNTMSRYGKDVCKGVRVPDEML